MQNLRQLKAFDAVIRLGTVTAAAESLHVSQPSVTRLINDLEANLGFKLFLRHGRGLIASPEARRFHRSVESTLANLNILDDEAKAIREATGSSVSLGAIASLSLTLVPQVLSELLGEGRAVQATVNTRNTPAIVESVRLQQLDLGLVGRSPPYEGVHVLYHRIVGYVGLVPDNHRLAGGRKPLDLETLADSEEFIASSGAIPDTVLDIDKRLSARMRAKARISAVNMPTVAALVRHTGLLGIADPFTAQIATKIGGVQVRPLRQRLNYHIAIITKGLDTITADAQILADALEKTCETWCEPETANAVSGNAGRR